MANRFQKSIEQLETSKTSSEDTPLPFMETATPPQSAVNIGDFLDDIKPQNQQGKNITFYLSHDVFNALGRIAEQKRISKSKIVDKALRQVLSL